MIKLILYCAPRKLVKRFSRESRGGRGASSCLWYKADFCNPREILFSGVDTANLYYKTIFDVHTK